MNGLEYQPVFEEPAAQNQAAEVAAAAETRPIPRISLQAFCETPAVSEAIEQAAADRRMAKAHVKVHMGGIGAARDFYATAPTPNLIVIETRLRSDDLLGHLDNLAEVCDAGTKVLVIGHVNDVLLYRDLIRRGVSDYLIAPLSVFDVIRTVGDIYHDPEAEPLGRSLAFIGAKGGCGSSTVAHNIAWVISRAYESDVVLADLDLAFGTAGLDFNQDPIQGIVEAVSSPDRLDDVFIDRLLAKCTEHLSLLAAPATLDRAYDYGESAFDNVIDILRQGIPAVVLDLPHLWSGWTRQVLRSTDDLIITAAPDLANLRNAKNLVDYLKQHRPNDTPPKLILNQIGLPKRPEIRADEFIKALGIEPLIEIPFDAQLFGTAANNGQMIGEVDPKHAIQEMFMLTAQVLTGRAEVKRNKRSSFAPFLSKLRGKRSG